MNDEELLENVVNQLISLDTIKWAKRYRKNDYSGRTSEFRKYSTKIGEIDLEVYAIDYQYSSPISRFFFNLFLGSSSYHLTVYNGKDFKSFDSKKNKSKVSKLYHAIEEKVGRISDKNKEQELLTSLEKALNRSSN